MSQVILSQGVWGTFETVLDRDDHSFENPFEHNLWILVIEISHLANQPSWTSLRIVSKHNLYTPLMPEKCVFSGQIRVDAERHSVSGLILPPYSIWRKGDQLRVKSGLGNFLRVTGQFVRSESAGMTNAALNVRN